MTETGANGGTKDSDPNDDIEEPAKPYIAIVVLVCGVIGGLIIVISFIFFCKFCFKKKEPLASAVSDTEKNEPYVIKPKIAKPGYQILDGSNSLASPVPADLETYLQQPANTNNNNLDLKPDFLLFNQTKPRDIAAQKKLCQLAEDELLIVQTEIAEEDKRSKRHHSISKDHSHLDNLFQKCLRQDSDDIEVLSIKQANNRIKENQPLSPYANSKRQRAYSNVTGGVHSQRALRDSSSRMNTLTVEDPTIEPRRRSFDERLTMASSPSGKRRLPIVAQLNDYYANEYDRKQYSNDTSLMEDEAQLNSLSTAEEVSLQVPAWPPRSPQMRSPVAQMRSPGTHLPRSHQTITDKTSPPRRPRLTSELPILSPKIYPRDHRNSKSYGIAEQDLSGSNKMYTRDHRMAFSFTDTGTGEERHYKAQPTILLSPDHRSESSMNSGYEAETLNIFYRQCQEIFNKNPPGYVSALSSSSSGNQYAPNGRLPSRQVKSVEIADRYRTSLPDRQAQSLDNNCKVCLTDAMNRLALYNDMGTPSKFAETQQFISGNPNYLRRQRPFDEADPELEHLDDAKSEEIKSQCKQLWSLRSVLENGQIGEVEEDEEDDVNEIDEYALRSPDGDDGGGTTSYTTSFESNTEPLTMEDYLRSTRPSGPFLEPPRLSLEAKRAKLKSLYAKRQMQLQQQGVSVESYESYDTVDSSESSKPEQILTSFESNQGEQTDSTVDSRRKMVTLQKDSGYKSQSTEAGHLYDLSFDKILLPPTQLTAQKPSPNLDQSFDSNASDLLDVPDVPVPPPAPADHHRKHYTTSRERDVAEAFFEVVNGNETDSKSDQPSGESFDDPYLQGSGLPMPKYPNVHLARMRRSYQSTPSTSYKNILSRDYSVDAHTDALYREFMNFDPRLETRAPLRTTSLGRSRFSTMDADVSKSRRSSTKLKQKLSAEDSIEEEHVGPSYIQSSTDYVGHGQIRYDIPIIKLSDDNEVFSGVKVQ